MDALNWLYENVTLDLLIAAVTLVFLGVSLAIAFGVITAILSHLPWFKGRANEHEWDRVGKF